jgi:hypothetical protein
MFLYCRGGLVIFNKVLGEGLLKTVNPISGKGMPVRRNSTCKGPEAGMPDVFEEQQVLFLTSQLPFEAI